MTDPTLWLSILELIGRFFGRRHLRLLVLDGAAPVYHARVMINGKSHGWTNAKGFSKPFWAKSGMVGIHILVEAEYKLRELHSTHVVGAVLEIQLDKSVEEEHGKTKIKRRRAKAADSRVG